MEQTRPDPPRISKRDVLSQKLNPTSVALWEVLSDHVEEPMAVLREILEEVGGQTVYLPVVESAERADIWWRTRVGEDRMDIAAEMGEHPFQIRQVANQPFEEL